MIKTETIQIPLSPSELIYLYGANNQNLKYLETRYSIEILDKGEKLVVTGSEDNIDLFKTNLKAILKEIQENKELSLGKVKLLAHLQEPLEDSQPITYTIAGKHIFPKTKGQLEFYQKLQSHDMTFCLGPAGTGKTFLAVAYGVKLLRDHKVKRIILVRPAVEAGENLGFLPGDLKEKVDPYLQPLYDALNLLLGVESVNKYIEKGIIEIAPLAYMRGRTLDDAVIILDEAQNATKSQMKMFLTRLGYNSTMIINGDITQIDLKYKRDSGLLEALSILKGIDEIAIMELTNKDIVRHALVSKIIERYQSLENE